MQFYNTVPILGRKPGEIIQGWRTSFMPAAQDGPVARMSMVMILNSSLALAESNWTYYKVWPEYVDMFLKTRLDNIPLTSLRFPFPAWTLQLPVEHPIILLGRKAATISVYFSTDAERSAMLRRYTEGNVPANPMADGTEKLLYLQINMFNDEGNRVDSAVTLNISHILETRPGATVEDAIDHQRSSTVRPFSRPGDPSHESWCESTGDMLRLVLSVAFIATGEYKFVNRDVLSDDVQKYRAALTDGDQELITKLGDKADRRRSSRGFTIGKFHAIDVLAQKPERIEGETDEQYELRHQHIRSGHFHAYWCGPGRQERKVRFLAPVIVRPDLPPPPSTPSRLIKPPKK